MEKMMPVSTPGHITALDGLRGLAILLVLIWHYFDNLRPFFPGWAGVDLFFVLSGYLITGRLLETIRQPDYFSRFYRNRALRILPVYYALLLVFLTGIILLVKNEHLPTLANYTTHWKSFFLFTQNWTFINFGIPKDVSLLPTWSLAVEEQFYLVWPLIIFLLSGFKTRLTLFTTLIVVIMLGRSLYYIYIPASRETNYYNTFFRLDGLLIGSVLCLLHHGGVKIPVKIVKWIAAILSVLILASLLSLKNAGPFNYFSSTIGYTVFSILDACLLHTAVQPGNGVFTRFLNQGFFRYCGKISYGLYLFHVPVLLVAGTKIDYWGLEHWPQYPIFIQGIKISVCLLLSFLISTLSYRYFESCFLRMKTTKSTVRRTTAISE